MLLLTVGKILHVIGNVLWLGGGVIAAFALANVAGEQTTTRVGAARALRIASLVLITPGMLLSLGAGLAMVITYWHELYAKAPWMHAKLTAGFLAAAVSGMITGRLRRASQGDLFAPGPLWLAGLVLLLCGAAAVSFAITRFGQ